MLEFALDARRGNFHLKIESRFASDWTVIFGPSGSGKSTLLRLLAGLDLFGTGHPRVAKIALDGNLLTDLEHGLWTRPGRRQTSMVGQEPALFPHLSVAGNVGYGLSSLDRGARATRVKEMLDLVDGSALFDRHPRDLSGGEAQRVALARALATAPRLLLLDEPFSALDGASSDALLSRLRNWATTNRVQTVMATHDAADALATGAEVALLGEGRLTALGPAAQVLASERSRLLKRLG